VRGQLNEVGVSGLSARNKARESDGGSESRDIPYLLRKPCDANHSTEPLDSIMTLFSSLKLSFFKVPFNIILLSRPRCSKLYLPPHLQINIFYEEHSNAVLSNFTDVSEESLVDCYLCLLNDSEGGDPKRRDKSTKLESVTCQKITLSINYKCLNTKHLR
jgi:hypothetical protein